VGLLAGCGGTPSPTGSYTTTIPGRTSFISGVWKITFGRHGTYTITSGSEVGLSVGKGSHVRGTTFVINPDFPNSCGPGRGTGTYTLKLTGNTLRFIRITDPCRIRAAILAYPYTKTR
jgi:hypothetical protein